MPHMHLRGKSFQVQTIAAGSESIILDVPQYDFNWQHTYQWKEPIPLQNFDQLSFTATFDNSIDNPFNPDPNQFVMWGDQTWEEMAVAFFEVARPKLPRIAEHGNTKIRASRASASSGKGTSKERSAAEMKTDESKAIAFADDFLRRFDADGDQVVLRTEVTRIVRDYTFRSIDADNDGRVTREELLNSARSRSGR
jgi:hypothetical protein